MVPHREVGTEVRMAGHGSRRTAAVYVRLLFSSPLSFDALTSPFGAAIDGVNIKSTALHDLAAGYMKDLEQRRPILEQRCWNEILS